MSPHEKEADYLRINLSKNSSLLSQTGSETRFYLNILTLLGLKRNWVRRLTFAECLYVIVTYLKLIKAA